MSHRVLFRMLTLLAILGLAPIAADGQPKAAVTVSAAASLREAFEAAAPQFTAHTGYTVRYDFGGSDMLAAQLLNGAPADVFAAANAAQMERVATLTEAPRTLAKNRLVVIAPRRDDAVRTLGDLGKRGVRLVIAAPTVPVGAYSRAAFARLEGDPAYGAGFAARVEANVVSQETDVKAIAAKVALGEADAGVVYVTDVAPIAANVRVLRFPNGVAPEAVYPIAVVKAAPNLAGARAFVDFITSPAGQAFLRARGFER